MGLRIIDRRDIGRFASEQARDQLLKIEAQRWCELVSDEGSHIPAEFLEKINKMRKRFSSDKRVDDVAENLEKKIRKQNSTSTKLQKPVTPKTLLDLL